MNIPKPPTNKLLDSERKALFGRITEYVGGIFHYMTNYAVPKWTATEIAKTYDIQNSNISMIQKYDKYKREISFNELQNLLMGDLVTVQQLTESCARSDKEKRYLEDKFEFIRLKKLAEENDIDLNSYVRDLLKSKGVDVNKK